MNNLTAEKIGVVLTTYNHAKWLDMVLLGYSMQSVTGFHVYVADDGSGEETKAIVEKYSKSDKFHLHHIWHEDKGFRKCEILNKCIAHATQLDYMVFTDGDCVPAPDLIEQHLLLAERGRFLSGGYCKLARETSLQLTAEDVINGNCFNLVWLTKVGTKPTRRLLKLLAKPHWFETFLDTASTAPASFNGHNSSAWRDDLLLVNGFDQRMEWGGLDREIGERLENAGVMGKRIRHRVKCVHLWHKRGYKKPESIAFNRALRRDVREHKITRTPAGITS